MMLKRKIKIIIVGLFSLFFIGLLYSLFGGKPEIIADESLRVEEVVTPEIESPVGWASDDTQSLAINNNPDDSRFKISPIEQAPTNSQELAISQVSNEESQKKVEGEGVSGEELAELIESTAESQESSVVEAEKVSAKKINGNGGFLVFDEEQPETIDSTESSQNEPESDVALIPESAGFLDLNLAEVKSHQPTMVLVEGDQLVIDDINQGIKKYEPSVSESAVGEAELVSLAPASSSASIMPSVFTMPEIDETLMQGDSEISQQYRQTMSKLLSVRDDLRAADEENAALQTQFDMTVNHNRKLAQIIRNIDFQIKSFTSTN